MFWQSRADFGLTLVMGRGLSALSLDEVTGQLKSLLWR